MKLTVALPSLRSVWRPQLNVGTLGGTGTMDLAAAHDWIVDELRSRSTLVCSMRALIDKCAAARAHRDWAVLRELDYTNVGDLLQWLTIPFQREPHPRPLKALWFGLFNPVVDGVPSADLYVSGSERFTPDPDDNSWAVSPDWWPRSRYADSTTLRDIYDVAHRSEGLENDAEYPLALGYAAFAVRDLLATIDPQVILGGSSSLGVAVGFDSGDFVLLGELNARGLITLASDKPA